MFALRKLVSLVYLTIIITVCGLSSSVYANGKNAVDQLLKPNHATDSIQSSPVFEGRGDGETTCPVTGEKITRKNYRLTFAGREVYFCCKGCFQRGKHKPEKYLKPTLAEQKRAVEAYLANAPKAAEKGEVCDE